MLSKIHARFATLALLVAASAFVFSACDSGGDGASPGPVTTSGEDTLQVSSVTPDVGSDLDDDDLNDDNVTTFKVKFSASVVNNEYTDVSVDPRDSESVDNGNRRLVDEIALLPSTAKTLTPENTIPVEVEWKKDRTRLDITPEKSLQDGYVYQLSLGDAGTNSGVYDPRFKSKAGVPFQAATGTGNPAYSANNLSFSVGIDEEKPAVPDVVFNDDSPAIASDTDLEDDVFNYTDDDVIAPLEVLDAADADNVKGYEVYYRSQNQVGGGDGDSFVKAVGVQSSPPSNPFGGQLSSEASSGNFEDWSGIIPASDVADGEFDDGDLEFTVQIGNNDESDDSPFAADDGTYGPIEWKFRAVSINGVRSDFTSVVTTPDNEELEYTATASGFSGGDITEVTVNFDEPVQTSTVDAGDFAIEFDGTNNNADVDISVDDNGSGDDDGDVIVLGIIENTVDTDDIDTNDDLTVSGIEDLAGNGIDTDENDLN